MKKIFLGTMLLTAVAFFSGCQTTRMRSDVQPIRSIRVGKFQCDNETIGESARNVFVELLVDYGDVKVVREGEADVVVEGTVSLANGGASSGATGGFSKNQSGVSFGGQSQIDGGYVSGVTSVAVRDGAIIASASWGQIFGKKKEFLPPQTVAREAAHRLSRKLADAGMRVR